MWPGYWVGVLYRFRQMVKEKRECDTAYPLPMTSSRLASHATILRYAKKHNLPYIQRWTDGSEEIMGCPGGSDFKSKGKAKHKSSKREITCSSGKGIVVQELVKPSRSKVDLSKLMRTTSNGVKVVMPAVRETQEDTAVTEIVATSPESSRACKQTGLPNPSAGKGTKRKAESSAPIRLGRSNNLRRRKPSTLRGPPVYIELSEVEHGDEECSDESHEHSSIKVNEDKCMSGTISHDGGECVGDVDRDVSELALGSPAEVEADEYQAPSSAKDGPASLGGEDNGVGDEVGNDFPSAEVHEGERIAHREDDRVLATDASPNKLSGSASCGNTVTAAPTSSINTDTGIMDTDTAVVTKTSGPALTTTTPLSLDVSMVKTPSSIGGPSTGTCDHEDVLDCHKVPSSEVQCSEPDLPVGKFASEWAARMDEFMVKFDSEVECISGMDEVIPTLSGVFVEFQGMSIPSELADPLKAFIERFCEGNVLSLVKKDYTLKKKRELIIDFGKLLFSMEVHQVQDEETFLIWRDACRDFAQAGLDTGYMVDSLKEAARHYFGFMMRPEGSDSQFAKLRKLQEEILQTKKKLALLEDELNETQSDLGLNLCDNPKAALDHMLELPWTRSSRVTFYLYKEV